MRKVISRQERVRPDQVFHVVQILLCQPLASAKLTAKSKQPSNPAAKHLETSFSKVSFTQQCYYWKPFNVNVCLLPQVSVWLPSCICNRKLHIHTVQRVDVSGQNLQSNLQTRCSNELHVKESNAV